MIINSGENHITVHAKVVKVHRGQSGVVAVLKDEQGNEHLLQVVPIKSKIEVKQPFQITANDVIRACGFNTN